MRSLSILIYFVVFIQLSSSVSAQVSSLVSIGESGKLEYSGYANEGQNNADNTVIDFSRAGYMGGGVAIPYVPAVTELQPTAGTQDDYPRIQAAIDAVSNRPLSPAGFRGAILLRAGTYNVSQTLRITASGIVIRGEGQQTSGTVVRFTATTKDNLFEFSGTTGWNEIGNTPSTIAASPVPCGASSLEVDSASQFGVGDRVIVNRTPNQNWIDLLEMAQWGWDWETYASPTPRTIIAIDGNRISFDAPVVHAIESRYGGGEVFRYQFDGAIRQVGIERLRLVSSFTSDTDEDHGWDAVKFERTENAWARQITSRFFGYSCVYVDNRCQFVTVEDCAQIDPKSILTGGRRYSFVVDDSTYILFQRCYADNGRHDFVTHSRTAGPVVFLDCLAENAQTDIGPHHRYAEGILFDNVKGKEINVQNRAHSGTGHGWSGAQIVFWNCDADSIICDAPKAAMNFAIGCVGTRGQGKWVAEEPFGIWESRGIPVTPRSLYYKQLQDRLGLNALLTVTNQAQVESRIWNRLSSWRGGAEAPDLPTFAPLQVDAGIDKTATLGDPVLLNAIIRYPLPENYPVTRKGWRVISGPGSVSFSDPSSKVTSATFSTSGNYELEFAVTQIDPTSPNAPVSHSGTDQIVIEVGGPASQVLNPSNFVPLGSISDNTAPLTFNTDTLQMSGGIQGQGTLVNNEGSFVAVFPFQEIQLTNQPTILGSRPLALVSQGDLLIASTINVRGGDGRHTVHGEGLAGGGDGGDANRTETSGNPLAGSGTGGSAGNATGNDDSTSGGGGFGGGGGNGTTTGGEVYGNRFLTQLVGGSGAGGTRNKGGGAGGGAVALFALGTLEITQSGLIDANGGSGGGSTSQYTAGGGSGGAIRLEGKHVIINGSLSVKGGDGGDGKGGQPNGGGGGGGRIAIFYQSSLDTSNSTITALGGIPRGTNTTGRPGELGTVHIDLNKQGMADFWLTNETGIAEPGPEDWLKDYDHDGLSAQLEYALGGSTSSLDHHLLPRVIPGEDGDHSFAFSRRREGGITPADYTVQVTSDLSNSSWQSMIIDESRTVAHPTLEGFDHVFVTVPGDLPRHFVRLKIR